MNTEANESSESGFISHLMELRTRLVRSVIAILLVFIVLFLYPGTGRLYDFIALPMVETLPVGHKMIATGVITPFMVPLKVTLLISFLIALPYVLYQAWSFIAPGLYKHEKQFALPLIISSSGLFFLGMAFCYFIVFRTVFHFIAGISPSSIQFAPDIQAYLSFVMTMFLAFGLTFQVPVLVVVLVRTGFVSLEKLKNIRAYVIVGAFVVAAVVTPPDVLSQTLLALPLILLFELGIFVGRFVKPHQTSEKDAADS